MRCDLCDELAVSSGNASVYPYTCKTVKRKILRPWETQEWCPKRAGRKKEPKRIPKYTQTTEAELIFMNNLSSNKLPGYLEGLYSRDAKLTSFNLYTLIEATRKRLKETK